MVTVQVQTRTDDATVETRRERTWTCTYGYLLYGATLTAIAETVLMLAVPRWRRPGLVITTAAIGFLAPFCWQVVLKITHSDEFYTDYR